MRAPAGRRGFRSGNLAGLAAPGGGPRGVEREGRVLPNGTRVFAVYHCAARVRKHRPMEKQREDWERIRGFV
jgi:uracil-DNA glycosylase